VANALVKLMDGGAVVASTQADEKGQFSFLEDIPDGKHVARCELFGDTYDEPVEVVQGRECDIRIDCDPRLHLSLLVELECKLQPATAATSGKRMVIRAERGGGKGKFAKEIEYQWKVRPDIRFARVSHHEIETVAPADCGHLEVDLIATEKTIGAGPAAFVKISHAYSILPPDIQTITGDVAIKGPVSLREVKVQLQRAESCPTKDEAFWVAIQNRTRAMSFARYQEFMNRALCWEERSYDVPKGIEDGATRERIERDLKGLGTHLHGVKAYQTLKLLTETFLLLECGVRIEKLEGGRSKGAFDYDEEESCRLGERFTLEGMEDKLRAYLGDCSQLPYITRVVQAAFPEMDCSAGEGRVIQAKINEPCLIELIWSYWHEEGMLVQTMNAVSQRFQNVRGNGDRDPLANMEIDPLRPLNNLLWGYVQDEFNRLTVRRRAYEYIHHYGLTLYGKAASGMHAADRRSKFLEAFHNLLYKASVFFKEDFQTTVIADGFPLLNSLKEVHLILAQGFQNQAGDLPWTARVEMLLMQYMLARREIRDFLQSRAMVPYKEPWEAQVDTMKSLQGWTDVTVSHFRDLAVYGEQLLLAIRYGDWINVNNEDSAKNLARFFRNQIQGYIHAYRAVTGIDLTNPDTVDATIPGLLLQKRMAMQRAR
jgi:hypothetical protein